MRRSTLAILTIHKWLSHVQRLVAADGLLHLRNPYLTMSSDKVTCASICLSLVPARQPRLAVNLGA